MHGSDHLCSATPEIPVAVRIEAPRTTGDQALCRANRQPPAAARDDETRGCPEDRAENQAGREKRDGVHRFHAPGAERFTHVAHGEAHRVRQPPGEQAGTHQARTESEGRSDRYQYPHKINFVSNG